MSPWSSLTPCCMHHVPLSLRSSFAAWTDAAGKSSKSHFFVVSFPALLCCRLELTQCLCKAAITKPNPGQAGGWEWGVTLRSPCTGDVPGAMFGCFAPRGQLWQTAPFLPLHCHIGKKMGGDNYCSSPSLLTRAWQGDGTCHSQAYHLLTQQLGGRGVGSCSILLHSLAIRKVSCFWFCV